MDVTITRTQAQYVNVVCNTCTVMRGHEVVIINAIIIVVLSYPHSHVRTRTASMHGIYWFKGV